MSQFEIYNLGIEKLKTILKKEQENVPNQHD